MPAETTSLVLMTLFFLFAWLPVSLGKYQAFGGKWLASNRNPVEGKTLPSWAQRCERAHNNLKDYFPGFVVAVLLLAYLGRFDESTKIAALIFVLARISHYVAYGYGNVPFRALGFFISMGANLYLLFKAF